MDTIDRPTEDGFELVLRRAENPGDHDVREFFPWHLSDVGKDLQLIDRFTGMPVHEFFELIEDHFDRGRAPVLLAMIATSVRAKHPDWTVERIVRLVQGMSLGADVAFIDAETEEQPVPPASGGAQPPSTSETSDDSANGSSSSSIQTEN